MNNTLTDFYHSIKNQSDKGRQHSYIQQFYSDEFTPRKDESLNILEIGVREGDSIDLWSKWFSNSNVYGIDIEIKENLKNKFNLFEDNENVKLYLNQDGYDEKFVEENFEDGFFDYIIDDGPHSIESQISFVNLYYPKLKNGGKLVIEDIANLDKVISKFKELKIPFKCMDLRADRVERKTDNVLLIFTKTKIGLTVTTHWSDKIRPNGHFLLTEFLNSFRESNFNYDYKIYLVDNGSEYEYNLPEDLEIDYYKIEDQTIGGLTGAWNKSFDMAYKDGCDFIWNFNDDLVLNESINNFIEDSIKYPNNAIFGPLTDNGGHKTTNSAPSASNGYEVLDVRKGSWNNLPNGFSFGFTRETYELGRHKEDEFFPVNHSMNNKDGKWGAQEGYFSLLTEKKIECVLIKSCWIEHKKLRTWLTAKNNL